MSPYSVPCAPCPWHPAPRSWVAHTAGSAFVPIMDSSASVLAPWVGTSRSLAQPLFTSIHASSQLLCSGNCQPLVASSREPGCAPQAALEAVWHVPCGGAIYGDDNLVFIANDWHTALLPVYLQVGLILNPSPKPSSDLGPRCLSIRTTFSRT